jgi:hypothetical protein
MVKTHQEGPDKKHDQEAKGQEAEEYQQFGPHMVIEELPEGRIMTVATVGHCRSMIHDANARPCRTTHHSESREVC